MFGLLTDVSPATTALSISGPRIGDRRQRNVLTRRISPPRPGFDFLRSIGCQVLGRALL